MTCPFFFKYDHPEEATKTLQALIDETMRWADEWFVTINPNKTESVTFSRKRDLIIPEIRINSVVIAEVEEHRHLGIILQRNGKWTSQIKTSHQEHTRGSTF